jgi:hypothetical protein
MVCELRVDFSAATFADCADVQWVVLGAMLAALSIGSNDWTTV